jgi:hypothetical protein
MKSITSSGISGILSRVGGRPPIARVRTPAFGPVDPVAGADSSRPSLVTLSHTFSYQLLRANITIRLAGNVGGAEPEPNEALVLMVTLTCPPAMKWTVTGHG